jgi:mono/diheme cytochrome c family protein
VGRFRKLSRIALGIAGLLITTISSARGDSASDEAKALMADRCAVCHGENGDGHGPGAANLNPKPQDFRDRKWQKSVSDETLTKVIVDGGQAIGLSASMPGNPDLAGRPNVVAAMIKQIRALRGKSATLTHKGG